MKRKMPLFVVVMTLAGAILILLSVIAETAPAMVQDVLPIGGRDFIQMSIIFLIAIVICLLVDLFNRRS